MALRLISDLKWAITTNFRDLESKPISFRDFRNGQVDFFQKLEQSTEKKNELQACKSRGCRGFRGCYDYGRSVNPILNRRGRLCPPHRTTTANFWQCSVHRWPHPRSAAVAAATAEKSRQDLGLGSIASRGGPDVNNLLPAPPIFRPSYAKWSGLKNGVHKKFSN